MRWIEFLLLSIFIPVFSSSAIADDSQLMTVSQLVGKCSAPDSSSEAFCLGLATGVLSQLQANGNFYMISRSSEARKVLKTAGAACAAVEPKLALSAFIDWAKMHPDRQNWNGISGISAAIQRAWPCNEHL